MLTRVAAVAAMLACLTVLSGAASAAAVSVSQRACDKAGQPACVTFNGTSNTIITARSIVFAAPSRGTAVVTFHGYMTCGSADVSQRRTLDLRMQIVDGDTAPIATAEGGMAVQTTIGNVQSPQGDNSETFNLFSTRTFAIAAAGNKTFRFKIRRTTMEGLTNCTVHVATFTVQFVP